MIGEIKIEEDILSNHSSKFAFFSKNTVAIPEVIDSSDEDQTPTPKPGEGSWSPQEVIMSKKKSSKKMIGDKLQSTEKKGDNSMSSQKKKMKKAMTVFDIDYSSSNKKEQKSKV